MQNTSNSADKQIEPGLSIPPPIRSDVPGSWAHGTMSRRVREIARRTLVENDFPPEISGSVEALVAAIPDEPIRFLQQDAPDATSWAEQTRPYVGQHWLTPPWFFSETYFYRRLIEATGYYESGPGLGHDPFWYQKEQGLVTGQATIEALATHLQAWLGDGRRDEHLAALLAVALWGNRADLSLWPAGESTAQPMDVDWQAAREYNLADDTADILRYLHGRAGLRVDVLIDNAGVELVSDLALADYLLSTAVAAQVIFHVKQHPTFVSDAMIRDVQMTADYLAQLKQDIVVKFGRRLQDHLANGRLLLEANPFWVSSFALWEMPATLRQTLSQSGLIISKGDANYRRLLGDRHWPFTTPFADIMSYAPAPLIALRALKAELACGLQEEDIERLDVEDPTWMVNGRWGVIQFALPGGMALSDAVDR